MAEVIGWDLDSSVCSTVHRRHLIPEIRAGRKTWHDYSLLCLDDEPIEGSVSLMRLMYVMNPEVQHIAISGRSERALELTRQWSHRHGVPFSRYMLRPDDAPNGEWKVRCIRQLEAEGHTVWLFVEDWGPAAKQIREETGVPVLGLNPFDPDTVLVSRSQLARELSEELEPGNPESCVCMADAIFARLAGAHA